MQETGILTLSGSGFTKDTQVSIEGGGLSGITPEETEYLSPVMMYATFDLTGLEPGKYSVKIKNPDKPDSVLSNAFEIVTTGRPGRLYGSASGPASVRPTREYTYWIEYGNDGDRDLPAPLLIISNTVNAQMRLSEDEPFREGPVQILGTSLSNPAGLMPANGENRVPVYMKIPTGLPGHSIIELNVEKMVADTVPIDWSHMESSVRPEDMGDDAWAAVWTNFTSQLGNTWYEYLKQLDSDATYIKRYRKVFKGSKAGGDVSLSSDQDISVYDVSVLLQFEFAKASANINPRTKLAEAQDVLMPAPGLPLAFGRFAHQSIQNRFHTGPFGRGWAHSYEYTASVKENDDIKIKGPGGSIRSFTSLGNGNYRPSSGDYASVTKNGDMITLREKDGMIFSFEWRTDLPSSDPDGNIRLFELVRMEDPNGNNLTFSYNDPPLGGTSYLAGITHSNGDSITFTYSYYGLGAERRISAVTDSKGRSIVYTYSGDGEYLLSVEEPGGIVTYYSYNSSDGTPSSHALSSITFPDNTHQYYSYDSKGRLAEEWMDDNTGHVTYSYDKQGTVTVEDALGRKTTIRFGPYGEILQTTDALGRISQNAFDRIGQVAKTISPDSKEVLFAYDGKGNTVGVKDQLNNVVQMSYETERSRLKRLVDARSNETDFTYDGKGNMTAITYPDTSIESFAYDNSGNLESYTNRRSQPIQNLYNASGQVVRKIYPDGRIIDYGYDPKGNMTLASDSLTGTITMQYDERNFMTRIDYPGGYGFTFEYDNSGKRTKRTSHDGYTIGYRYDSAGRLQAITGIVKKEGDLIILSALVSYEYDGSGRLTRELRANGTQTGYTYDPAGQLLQLVNYAPDGGIQSRFDYTYDMNGNRTSMTTLEGTTSYQYDALRQLVGITYPGGRQVIYKYDAAGNRVTVTDNGALESYTTNNMNQYTTAGNAAYNYDADGNMISKTGTGGITTYSYDPENRLIKVVTPDKGTWEYTYDAMGNRTEVKHDGVVTRYVHDPTGLVDVDAEYDGSGNLIARYTYGIGLVSRSDGSDNRAYYAFDGIGHTRQLTDATGAVVNSYDYAPFGEPLNVTETIPNPFRYVGKFGVMEEGNRLSLMRARFYCPAEGRFMSIDPLSFTAGSNLYTYALNDPLTLIDPDGLFFTGPGFYEAWRKRNQKLDDVIKDTNSNTVCSTAQAFNEANEGVNLAGRKAITEFLQTFENSLKFGVNASKSFAKGGIDALRKYVTDWIIDRIKRIAKDKLREIVDNILKKLLELMNKETVAKADSEVITSDDPNEKVAPAGIGDQRYVVWGQEMSYTIYFENKATASAPAQEIFINDYLDADLDWSTFRLGEVSFGEHVVTSLSGKESGEDRVVLGDLAVDIEAQRVPGTGLVNWTLRTIDPETGELPEDPFAGLLPPEDGTGRGQGYVTFTVRSRKDRPAGTLLTNSASIVFDVNAPIITNEVFNTISDDVPSAPSSPDIPDGTVDVPLSSVLSWSPSEYATSYDLYLWESGQQKPDGPSATGLRSPFYVPSELKYSTTYLWQSVARNVMGGSEGPVWSFTTIAPANNAPFVPLLLSPFNSTTHMPLNIDLRWTGGDPDEGDTVMYDVYLDTVNPPLSKVANGQIGTSYHASNLSYGTTYYWQIIARDNYDAETAGAVWNFTTFSSDGDADNDGLTNQHEIAIGTNPFNRDTDGDGYSDGEEINAGSDPKNPASIPNYPPVADAGPDKNVITNKLVTLDGSDSYDPEGDLITFLWSFVEIPVGSSIIDASLSDTTSAKPTFIPDVDGIYRLKLIVNDGELDSDPDEVEIIATTPNVPPNADAGSDQNVYTGTLVQLDGSGSNDPDNGPQLLSHLWSFAVLPQGSGLTDADIADRNKAKASFVPDADGTYIIKLAVSDGDLASNDDVIIISTIPNVQPNANAGTDFTINLGETAILNGSASNDPDNWPALLTYSWRFVSVANGSLLTNANIINADTITPSLVPDVAGTYVLELMVSDGMDSVFDNVVVTVVKKATMGDLDNDGDVDQNDLNILLTYRNKPASVCPACDLDGDGKITVLDGRKLVLLCTRPRCATE